MRRSQLLMIVLVTMLAGPVMLQRVRADDAAGVPSQPQHITFTLGSYNCENFFDDKNDPYTLDETTAPKSQADLAELAKMIHAADADFLGVVETESEGALYEFNKTRLKDMKYSTVYVDHRDWGRGINNGCLTRLPIYSTTIYRFNDLKLPATGDERTWRFARDPVCFDLRPADGVSVEVFVVHFKSKGDSKGDKQSAKWRLSEATMLRKIIAEKLAKNPDALIAACGDFNDTPDSAPIKELLRANDDGKPVLIDIMAEIPADKRITYLKEPYRSTIDYILVSPALAKCFVPGTARIVEQLGVNQQLDASDHAPIMVKFAVPLPAAVHAVP